MQVFVPYADVKKSVECLDDSRLGNQIYREGITILRILKKGPVNEITGKATGWYNHPATQMWRNHRYYLCTYLLAGITELSYRGKHYPDTFDEIFEIKQTVDDTGPPIWWGDERVHLSHQSNLLRKDESHYRSYFGNIPNNLPYHWPQYSHSQIVKHGYTYKKNKKDLEKGVVN